MLDTKSGSSELLEDKRELYSNFNSKSNSSTLKYKLTVVAIIILMIILLVICLLFFLGSSDSQYFEGEYLTLLEGDEIQVLNHKFKYKIKVKLNGSLITLSNNKR